MAIPYPLTAPATPGNRSIRWTPRTVVGMAQSPFTGSQQVYAYPGQWWEVAVELPPMTDAVAGAWCGFFLALNGREGTFLLGDTVRKTRLGSVTGTLTIGAGAVANTTTLPIAGATGGFAVGDWIQVGAASNSRLHRVVYVTPGVSLDVFPRLRTAYASGTAVNIASPRGLFRLQAAVPWAYDARKICDGLTFNAVEVVP